MLFTGFCCFEGFNLSLKVPMNFRQPLSDDNLC